MKPISIHAFFDEFKEIVDKCEEPFIANIDKLQEQRAFNYENFDLYDWLNLFLAWAELGSRKDFESFYGG